MEGLSRDSLVTLVETFFQKFTRGMEFATILVLVGESIKGREKKKTGATCPQVA